MLTEKEIDYLKYYTQTESEQDKAYVYYVAHMIEPREGVQDEHIYPRPYAAFGSPSTASPRSSGYAPLVQDPQPQYL